MVEIGLLAFLAVFASVGVAVSWGRPLVPATFWTWAVVALLGSGIATVIATEGTQHDLTVQFVSFDSKAMKVTFKNDAGEQNTVSVMESAANDFNDVKTGERVTLTCDDDDNGEHLGVSKAKRAPVEKKT